jgi:hypothetical protein
MNDRALGSSHAGHRTTRELDEGIPTLVSEQC